MSDEMEFDCELGGNEDLPRFLTLEKFIASRSQEIQIMKSTLMSQSSSKLAFQSLPVHMRRRAMSHNAKRLPRRLRQIHLNQMKKSGMPIQQKRPSRKYRRRPKNLMEEYTRRACKKFKWLHTHIWHAKRFHMVNKWGYKLPCHPRDKAFRACYRAMSQHCLLQDVSYLKCIEIAGDQNLIINKFKLLTRASLGLSIGARAFIRGNREGELTIFANESIQRPIGLVNFHWQPPKLEAESSKLWLWVHAAFYDEILNALVNNFKLTVAENCYCNEYNNITLLEISDLSRLRLIGPLANAVLQDALILVNPNNIDENSKLAFEKFLETMECQAEFWNKLKDIHSVAEISPHIILPLLVNDPRLNLPKKRTKAVPQIVFNANFDFPNDISQSPLWLKDIRQDEAIKKVPSLQLNELQEKLLVPGSDLHEHSANIPIILIQRPGKKSGNVGLGCGWDVIVPSSWTKPFWISFIMRGARAGGLRETKSILFEMGKSQFLQPDTQSGKEEELQTSKYCIEKFFKKPPNKRTNYNKFSITSPFCCDWNLLLAEWNEFNVEDDSKVLRDRQNLNQIDQFLNCKTNNLPEIPANSLLPVRLECVKRGALSAFAIICIPKTRLDLKQAPTELLATDKNQEERKETRRTHQILLKKLRKKRKLKLNSTDNDKMKAILQYKEILANYTKKMRELWLPQTRNIRNSCSREIMGFVNKGGFSYSCGRSCGTGYITTRALSVLLQINNDRNKVLVRNTNSRQYKVAKISVILE